jgi:hypothetical protein
MKIGFTTAGTIESFRDESITTRFFFVGPLFFPVSSRYETPRGAIEVPVHARSAAIGMLRLYAGGAAAIAVLLLGIGTFGGRETDPLVLPSIATLLVALPLALLAFLRLGKATPESQRRRELLRAMTGLGALPGWLEDDLVKKTRKALLADWDERRRAWDAPADWKAALEAGPRHPAAAKLLAAIAAYDEELQRGAGGSRALAERAFALALGEAPVTAAMPEAPVIPMTRDRIDVRCGDCRTVTSVASKHAGKRVRCGCGATTRVPGAKQRVAVAA